MCAAAHRQVLRLDLQGVRPGEISRLVGLSPAMVRYTRASTVYRSELASMQTTLNERILGVEGAIRERIGELSRRAILELKALLTDPATPLRVRAWIAMDILDRGGFKGAEKQQDEAVSFTEAVLQAYARRRAEREGASPGPTTDTVPGAVRDEA